MDDLAIGHNVEITGTAMPVFHPVFEKELMANRLGPIVLIFASWVVLAELTSATAKLCETKLTVVPLVRLERESWVIGMGMLSC
mmetsp:Transcript_4752/g.4653  ORF Transcript_4752/g.4653 Transcript_4752/m.4653 type:complete len:84 (+) Transcript_4752:120-371(+)